MTAGSFELETEAQAVDARRKPGLVQVNERIVRRIAGIMGQSSAAAQAIRDFERRRNAGEMVAFYRQGRAWVVGPDTSEATQ